jgi:hypothetical protein
MARPQKQTVDYFPHDAQASQGDTLSILQGKWGNDGYAFWFRLLEKLSSSEGHYIDCRNPVKWQLLLAKTQLNNGTGVEIMDTLVELDAIDATLWRKHKVIWCQNLVDNISDAYRNRRRPTPTKPVITSKNPITTDDNPQTKLNETKLYYIYKEWTNIKITKKEHKELIKKFGEVETLKRVEALSLYIASKGDKYKNHYATILNWERMAQEKNGTHQKRARALPKKYTHPDELRHKIEYEE